MQQEEEKLKITATLGLFEYIDTYAYLYLLGLMMLPTNKKN